MSSSYIPTVDSSRSMSLSIEVLANIGSFQWDAETNQLEWSEHLYRLYGYEPFSIPLSFEFFLSHLEEQNKEDFLNALYANSATGTEYQFEEFVKKKDGSKAILLSTIKPVLDHENRLVKVLGVCKDITELSKKDQQLLDQRAFFEKILDRLPVLVTVKDSQQRFKLLNKAYYDAMVTNEVRPKGVTSGSAVETCISEDVQGLLQDKAKEARSTDQEVKINTWIKNKNGEDRFYNLIKKSIAVDGEDELLTVALDRTDEFYLEQALRDNEERLSIATEGAQIGILDWDLSSDVIKGNDTYFELIGKKKGDYIPAYTSFRNSIIHQSDLELVETTLKQILEHKPKTYELEYRINHSSKGIVWIHHKGTVIQKKGAPYRIVAVLQDITHRKYNEDRITRSNIRLNNIIKSAPGVVFTFKLDMGLPVLSLSDQITQLTEYVPEDFYPVGAVKFEELIVENDRSVSRELMMDTINQGKTEFQNSFRLITKSHQERWVWMKAQVSVNESGEDVLEGFLVDITEQINAEDRVMSATLQAEDNQRQRISEEIHDGVQQTLISALMGLQHLSDVIKEKVPEIASQYQMAVNTLKSGVEETRGIAHSIMPKSIEDFGLVETIEQVMEQLNSNTQTNFQFYQNLDDERLERKIEVSFYRIFQEAITNINKHANASEVSIQIRKSTNTISLNIEDDGDGFDYSKIDQLKAGFGLASMKSRAGSLFGNVEISSSPGHGTTILVEVPLIEADS